MQEYSDCRCDWNVRWIQRGRRSTPAPPAAGVRSRHDSIPSSRLLTSRTITGGPTSTADHKYGDMLTISPRSAQKAFWKLIDKEREARLKSPPFISASSAVSAVNTLPQLRPRVLAPTQEARTFRQNRFRSYWVRRYRRVRSTRANRLRTSGMTAWAHNGTAGHRTANAGASSGPA